ncbi:MAG TPA: DUF1707 domain-containing protein [Propionibacteriaceae bacterium]|nr:DUF1707 domain-containing protein [Propionibacteriaceae bacterium]
MTEADRAEALALLDAARAQGYLSGDEYEHRALAVRSAGLYDDLRPVTRDLDNVTRPVATTAPVVPAAAAQDSLVRVAFFSGSSLKGRWVAPQQVRLFAVFGGLELDFTDAVWTSDEIVVEAYAVFGGVDIKVPDGVDVVNQAVAVFGGADVKRITPVPGGRRVVLKGLAAFGGMDVKGPKPAKG